jgi:hypothetical protein
VIFFLDRSRAVATAEEASAASVTLVEDLRVGARQDLHSGRHLLTRRLDDHVEMCPHEAARVQSPVETLSNVEQEPRERVPVGIVAVQELVSRRAVGHVEEPVR